jgi:CheY-like chemotaxis protein
MLQPILLISDDNVPVLRALAREAGRHGVRVLLDGSGKVVELAREQRPAVILLDIHQGYLDGRDALARLRSDPRTADCEVIIMSGGADACTETECLVLGATSFEAKPIRPEMMGEIAKLITARAASEDAWASYAPAPSMRSMTPLEMPRIR